MNEIPIVRDLLVRELETRMFYSYSGALSFGDFHTGNIMLESKQYKIRSLITNRVSANFEILNRILVWVLDPEFFDAESKNCDRVDRMEDIANIFTSYIISEYAKKGKITESVNLIERFIIGYNFEFKDVTGITLADCYPRGSTLEYQLSQSILFDLIHYLRNQFDAELMKTGFLLRINLIKHLLKHRIDFISK